MNIINHYGVLLSELFQKHQISYVLFCSQKTQGSKEFPDAKVI